MNLGHERISKLDGNTFFFKNRQRKCEYTPGTQVLLRYTISCHANALYFVQCLQKNPSLCSRNRVFTPNSFRICAPQKGL